MVGDSDSVDVEALHTDARFDDEPAVSVTSHEVLLICSSDVLRSEDVDGVGELAPDSELFFLDSDSRLVELDESTPLNSAIRSSFLQTMPSSCELDRVCRPGVFSDDVDVIEAFEPR